MLPSHIEWLLKESEGTGMNTTQFIAIVLWFFIMHVDFLRLFRELSELRSDLRTRGKKNEPSDLWYDIKRI